MMVSPPGLSQNCLPAEAGDSRTFGDAIAISDNYIAVGDPDANRVVLYGNSDGDGESWSRIDEIYPPSGSSAEAVGAGFGYDLSIDSNQLIVGAYFETRRPADPETFQWVNQLGTAYSGGVYKMSLDEALLVERIDTARDAEISGFSVAASEGNVAFSTRTLQDTGIGAGRVELRGAIASQQVLPPIPAAAQSFGIDIALSERHLLVGAPFDPPEGAAWLFDLAGEGTAQRLPGSASSAAFAGSAVAQGDGFSAISAITGLGSARTVVISPGQASTAVEIGGQLSASGNLLSIAQRATPDREQDSLVRIFKVDTQGDLSPVLDIPQAHHAVLGENSLVFAQEKQGDREICHIAIEALSQE